MLLFDAPRGAPFQRVAGPRSTSMTASTSMVKAAAVRGSNLSDDQLLARGEELARSGVALRAERAGSEAGRREMNGSRVTVRIAGDLAEDQSPRPASARATAGRSFA